MGRFPAILLAESGTVALQVVAQAVVLASVRFIGRRTRAANEIRRTFWISLGAVAPLFSAISHRWDSGQGSPSGSVHSGVTMFTRRDPDKDAAGRK